MGYLRSSVSVLSAGAIDNVWSSTVPALGVGARWVIKVNLGGAHVVGVSGRAVPRWVVTSGAHVECLWWAESFESYNIGLVCVPGVVFLIDLHAQLVELLLDLFGVDILGVFAARMVNLALDKLLPCFFSHFPGLLDGKLNLPLELLDDRLPLFAEFFLENCENFLTACCTFVTSLEQLALLLLNLSVGELIDQVALLLKHGLVLGSPPVTLNRLIKHSQLFPGVVSAIFVVKIASLLRRFRRNTLLNSSSLVSEQSSSNNLEHIEFF